MGRVCSTLSFNPLLLIFILSVLELVEGLGDPDDAYKRKVKKGAHCVDISYVLALLILTLLALDDRLKRFPPAPSPSDLVHSSHKLADLLGGEMPSIHLGRPGGVPVAILTPPLLLCNGVSTTSKKFKFLVQKSSVLPSTSGVQLRFTRMKPTVRMRSRNWSMKRSERRASGGMLLVGRIISNLTVVGGTTVF
jgi:hypothetical protein